MVAKEHVSIPVERILDFVPNTACDAAVARQIDLPRSVTILDNAWYPDVSFSVPWLKVEVTTDIARATMKFGAGIRDSRRKRVSSKKTAWCGSWLVLIALGMSLASLRANSQTGQPTAGLINRSAIVYSRSTDKVYAVDKAHGAVSIVNATGTAKRVKVGSEPEAIAVNEQTEAVYVVNSGDRSVSVIDGKNDRVVATVATAARPYAIAIDESANKVYVSNTFSNMLTVIDGRTNLASNVKTGSADAIVVDAKRKRVYLLGYESNSLTVLNSETNAITKMPAGGMHLWATVQVGKVLYVTYVQDANVAAIDVETGIVRTIPTGAMPCSLAVIANTKEIYVANYGDGSVTVIDGHLGRAIGTVAVGKHPQAIAVDSTRGLVYVANTQESTVSVIDVLTRRVVKTLNAGEHPYAIAVNTTAHTVHVANLSLMSSTVLGNQ
jgi:YVTN family beta-propeller protein